MQAGALLLSYKEIKNEHSNQGSLAREAHSQPCRALISWECALSQVLRGLVTSALPPSLQASISALLVLCIFSIA